MPSPTKKRRTNRGQALNGSICFAEMGTGYGERSAARFLDTGVPQNATSFMKKTTGSNASKNNAVICQLGDSAAKLMANQAYFGFNCGNKITSRMLSWPSSIMHNRSMPMPMPPAGGIPCSSAARKSSSIFCCSPPA